MAEEKQERQDGSQPERGTGQRQDHRAAPPGHKIPGEPANLDDPERADEEEERQEPRRKASTSPGGR
jgi:hypothetical protein